MTQEDKELLLKDLCARLPYGVRVLCLRDFNHTCYNLKMIDIEDNEVYLTIDELNINRYAEIETIKPYLFPLSSLIEKQRNEISQLLIDTQNTFSPYGEINTKGCDNLFVCSVKQSNALIKYCLMHHLDINGLIEKGLAIDATGLNIY